MADFQRRRELMVTTQVEARGVRDLRVLEAMRKVQREKFLPANLRDETRLLTSGILDSMAGMELVAFIERTFGIKLSVYETDMENFDRLEDIAALVARKQAA